MNNAQNTALLLHACLLDVANEIKRICDKHRISYFLIGGTLLGCLRHEGIIPWDDDLDIGMLREDYERFLSVCESELREPFILCTAEKEKNYGVMFAKIRIEGTALYEKEAPADIHRGIFVDVFPIDRFPEDAATQKRHAKKLYLFKKLLLTKCHYNIPYGSPIKRLCFRLMASLFSKKGLVSAFKRQQTKFNGLSTAFYANYNGAYRYGKEIYPVDTLRLPLPERALNGYPLSVPHDPQKILTLMYGDYMTPPPPEMQVFGHANDFDFGDYEPRSLSDENN